jgi:putative peptidoglycan lipid II flippase
VGIHLFWQLPSLFKEGYSLKWVRPFGHPEVRNVFLLMIPTIIGLCADQVNSFVDQMCASFLREGSVTALYNSNRVMQLPLALFGVAVASVSLPALSRAASENDLPKFKNQFGFSIRIANFVLIPSFIGLAVLALPIVQALFERGRFTHEFSKLTVMALIPQAAGLPAFSMIKIFASAFYARKNTRTPVRVALWAMALNVVLNIALMFRFGVAGLAAATTVSAWFQAAVLFHFLRREMGPLGGRDVMKSYIWSTAAGLGMGLVCWGLAFHLLSELSVVLRVLISIGTGTALYFLLAKALKVKEYDFFVEALLRRKSRS